MPPPKADRQFTALLEYLKAIRGFDFTGYKSPSLMRRVQKRMHDVGVGRYADYIDYLEVHPEEFTQLFNTILINVTAFFRDPPAWEYLTRDAIPGLLEHKKPDAPIRVWSAGCASGEEAYTLAMVLAEALGPKAFGQRVRIFATDMDDEALNAARKGSYGEREVKGLPPGLLQKYFQPAKDRYVLHADLRRSIIFGRHDLLKDAPIPRIDVLVCRNTLMYFNGEHQASVLARFSFSLNDPGVFFLGKGEMLLTRGNTFTPLNLKWRVFSKSSNATSQDRALAIARPRGLYEATAEADGSLREAALDLGTVPQLVVDREGIVVLINDKARALFSLRHQDVGRPLQDLELSYRPVELRSHLEQAYTQRAPALLKEVKWPRPPDEVLYLDVQITPVPEASGRALGASITFVDVTRAHQLQADLQRANEELETAYEELQSANEELETTNEELQSTVEELETTNEELQATNEELETMNEELQATNEELRAANDEVQRRSGEMDRANAFLASVLAGLRSGVVVLDRDFRVQAWNPRAEDLWGLRLEEVRGQSLLQLDIGLPREELVPHLRASLDGTSPFQEVLVRARNRRGKPIQCHVTCTPLHGTAGSTEGVILLMEEGAPKQEG